MCGIVTAIQLNKDVDCPKLVWEQFDAQRHRGVQGFGFVAVVDNEVIWAKSTTEEGILKELKDLGNASVVIFHHRIPTCTPNSITGNHPILVANKNLLKSKYFIIHNGMISNSKELRTAHEALGFKYRTDSRYKYSEASQYWDETFTDSESLGIEMAKFIEGAEIMEAEGSIACFLLEMNEENTPVAIHYYRNTSPTNFYRNENLIFFSSEGKGQATKTGVLYTINLSDMSLSQREMVKKPIVAKEIVESKKKEDIADKTIVVVEESIAARSTVTAPPPKPPSHYCNPKHREVATLRNSVGIPTNLVTGSFGVVDLDQVYAATTNDTLKRLISKRQNLLSEISENNESVRTYEKSLMGPERGSTIDNMYLEIANQIETLEEMTKEIETELIMELESVMH